MLKIVLWLAAASLVVMGALLASRHLGSRPERAIPEPVAIEAPAPPPPVAESPTVAPQAPPPKPPEIDTRITDDAAAVGMTTREPPAEAPPH